LGEARGNYDEFRFFTGMRPSEQIALVLSDIDLEQGAVSVNKACVAGVDRDCTKTGEDRRIFLCPRALAILKSQLKLRAELEHAGRIQHDYVFFQHTGEPVHERRNTDTGIATRAAAGLHPKKVESGCSSGSTATDVAPTH
jgi:integrase